MATSAFNLRPPRQSRRPSERDGNRLQAGKLSAALQFSMALVSLGRLLPAAANRTLRGGGIEKKMLACMLQIQSIAIALRKTSLEFEYPQKRWRYSIYAIKLVRAELIMPARAAKFDNFLVGSWQLACVRACVALTARTVFLHRAARQISQFFRRERGRPPARFQPPHEQNG